MPDRDSHQRKVKKLLAQEPEINDIKLKEFNVQLEQSLESWEQKSKRTRRRALIALAVFLSAMVVSWFFYIVFWRHVALNAPVGIVRGLIYWSLAISSLAAAITGIWLAAQYMFKYAPQLSRARFEVQTLMMLELQQQVKQLREDLERRDK